MFLPLLTFALQIALGFAQSTPVPASVTVNGGTFVGEQQNQIAKFLGIRFAHPPVGDLRFRLPKPIAKYSGTIPANKAGSACTQRKFHVPFVNGLAEEVIEYILNSVLGLTIPGSEDCLFLNIHKPASADANSKLPVAFWIHGGGFVTGHGGSYDGSRLVNRSVEFNTPMITVSVNYRLGGFGFLAGKEVRDAGVGNLGIHDQREALRWVKKHISAFGGDPNKVTIIGESAGAISVAMQMLANNGNHDNLFRGAFMKSGGPIPTGSLEKAQGYYDDLVKATGCSGAADTLQCLRTVPSKKLSDAIEESPTLVDYQAIRLAWLPREDGTFITGPPMSLVQQGKIAKVPYITGSADDEGTVFSIATLNATTEGHFRSWLGNNLFPDLSPEEVDTVADLYPSNPLVGSPFNTGLFNAITPQFKRFAAFQGDAVFQAPRRWLLQHTADKQNAWSYVTTREKATPVLGASHLTINLYQGGDASDHLIRFVTNLDPNSGSPSAVHWPKYDLVNKKLLHYRDGPLIRINTVSDVFRQKQMDYINQVTVAKPI